MSMFSKRTVATAAAFAVALSASGVPAFAASNPDKTVQAQATSTDFSAAKKKRARTVRRGIDPAGRAFLGIAGAMFGAVAANIAAERYRERYYPYGYYGYQPYPYRPGPYYYGYPY